jgi:hypothetical protein
MIAKRLRRKLPRCDAKAVHLRHVFPTADSAFGCDVRVANSATQAVENEVALVGAVSMRCVPCHERAFAV